MSLTYANAKNGLLFFRVCLFCSFQYATLLMTEPPVKKVCIQGKGHGVKCEALHTFFSDVGGGRVRCDLCFKRWETESLTVALGKGLSEAEARKWVSESQPPSASVPTFNKTSPDNLRRHLKQSHGDIIDTTCFG